MQAAHDALRKLVPHMDEDRELHKDISAVAAGLGSIEAAAASALA